MLDDSRFPSSFLPGRWENSQTSRIFQGEYLNFLDFCVLSNRTMRNFPDFTHFSRKILELSWVLPPWTIPGCQEPWYISQERTVHKIEQKNRPIWHQGADLLWGRLRPPRVLDTKKGNPTLRLPEKKARKDGKQTRPSETVKTFFGQNSRNPRPTARLICSHHRASAAERGAGGPGLGIPRSGCLVWSSERAPASRGPEKTGYEPRRRSTHACV